MTNWRCPHCGTPQAEAARCWVCGRSSTTCSSCRHFRRSVALAVGYCALDPGRAPLSGDEVRPCWQPIVRSKDAPIGSGVGPGPTAGGEIGILGIFGGLSPERR